MFEFTTLLQQGSVPTKGQVDILIWATDRDTLMFEDWHHALTWGLWESWP